MYGDSFVDISWHKNTIIYGRESYIPIGKKNNHINVDPHNLIK